MNRFRKAVISAVAASVLAFGAVDVASAQSTLKGYSTVSPAIQEQVKSTDDGSAPTANAAAGGNDEAGRLPFPGLDLGLFGAAGVLLAGLGLGMRRMTRVPEAT